MIFTIECPGLHFATANFWADIVNLQLTPSVNAIGHLKLKRLWEIEIWSQIFVSPVEKPPISLPRRCWPLRWWWGRCRSPPRPGNSWSYTPPGSPSGCRWRGSSNRSRNLQTRFTCLDWSSTLCQRYRHLAFKRWIFYLPKKRSNQQRSVWAFAKIQWWSQSFPLRPGENPPLFSLKNEWQKTAQRTPPSPQSPEARQDPGLFAFLPSESRSRHLQESQ